VASQAAVGRFDPEVLFEEAPGPQGATVDRPDAVISVLETHVLPNAVSSLRLHDVAAPRWEKVWEALSLSPPLRPACAHAACQRVLR
jgi:hypothetical protein